MEEKQKIIRMHQDGFRRSKIAEKTRFKWSTVDNVIKKWTKFGTVANSRRFGRPRSTTPRQDRKIVQLAATDRRITLSNLTKAVENDHLITVSSRTIKRRLSEVNFEGRRARKKPLLSKNNIAKRLKWAKEHETWRSHDWSKVIWSDESKFCIFGNNGSKFVWRRPGEALKPICLQPTVKHGGG